MFALISFALAAACFLLLAFSVTVGSIHLLAVGLFLVALGFVLDRVPSRG